MDEIAVRKIINITFPRLENDPDYINFYDCTQLTEYSLKGEKILRVFSIFVNPWFEFTKESDPVKFSSFDVKFFNICVNMNL